MAKVTIILDKRSTDAHGNYPVKLRIVHNNTNTSISTGFFASEKEFIGSPDRAVARAGAATKRVNDFIADLYYTYMGTIRELERSGKLRAMTATDIRNYYESKKEYRTERTFSSTLDEYIEQCRADKTRGAYEYTKQKLTAFSGKNKLFFEDVNYKFLTDLERWLENNRIGMATRSIIFRNIRAVYNYALNNDWVNASLYPFRKFKVRHGEKEKVYLTEDKMRVLTQLTFPESNKRSGLELARDIFLLSFYLCGINPVDLFNMPKQSGEIVYVRAKVQLHSPKPIHLKIQPEAQQLIDKYQGEKYLCCFAEQYASFDTFYHFVKHRIKQLGKLIGCEDITLYWARYSWSTYASKIDVPDSTIDKALGHKERGLAQSRYISFDWRKVDKANRQVIDYINRYGKKK